MMHAKSIAVMGIRSSRRLQSKFKCMQVCACVSAKDAAILVGNECIRNAVPNLCHTVVCFIQLCSTFATHHCTCRLYIFATAVYRTETTAACLYNQL